jgi:hypothetical protein
MGLKTLVAKTSLGKSGERRVRARPMSVRGQSRRFGGQPPTSGLPLETDIFTAGRHVSKVPIMEVIKLSRSPRRRGGGEWGEFGCPMTALSPN